MDDLKDFHEETRRIVAEADALRDKGLKTRADIAKFAALMFNAGYTECQHEAMRGLPFLPFFSANFWNIPRAGYGLGIGRISGSSQRVEKGLNDAMLDILSFVSGKAK